MLHFLHPGDALNVKMSSFLELSKREIPDEGNLLNRPNLSRENEDKDRHYYKKVNIEIRFTLP